MAGLTASDGLDALSDCSPAQVLDLMSKEGRSLLLYLESCAVDCKGIVDVARMNESDVAVAKDWTRRGFIEFCRLKASMLPKQLPRPEARCPTHAVRLAGRAFHVDRRDGVVGVPQSQAGRICGLSRSIAVSQRRQGHVMGSATAQTFTVTPEQRHELRRRWVEALESGHYQQGKGLLCSGDKYCCLGVACDVFDKMFPGVLEIVDVGERRTFDHAWAYTPQKVFDALGLGNSSGKAGDDWLPAMNDRGVSFPEIAAVIRSNPPGLFATDTTNLEPTFHARGLDRLLADLAAVRPEAVIVQDDEDDDAGDAMGVSERPDPYEQL
jgi:hypothetical protein